MENLAINWEEVYQSLQVETIKASGRWMFFATLGAGLVVAVVLFFFFRKYPVALAIMVVGALVFSGKYAVGLWRLSKNPMVYSGVVIAKNQSSRTEESTAASYFTYRIRLNVNSDSELTEKGLGEIRARNHKRLKIACSDEIFNALTEGDRLMVVVMPHDKTIAWYRMNQLTF